MCTSHPEVGLRQAEFGSARVELGGDHTYREIVTRVGAVAEGGEAEETGEGWRSDVRDVWCVMAPPGAALRTQGWKIHLSATPHSAEDVLGAAARVLTRERVVFKFARDQSRLRSLLSRSTVRGSAGKFITVYPGDDTQFVRLLDALQRVTEGMEGPAVLSDRRYRPDSVVHYRYGGFGGLPPRLDDGGFYVPVLVAPDGGWAPDERNAWFSPPSWAALPPLPGAETATAAGDGARARAGASASGGTTAPSPVLLGGRFLVRNAVRHSNKGGVYRALDRHDGDRAVVLKEARPHIEAKSDGTDIRDQLWNEHRVLTLLEPLDIAVRPVGLFEYQGHVFLAEEEVPGASLRTWARDLVQAEPGRFLAPEQVLPVARRLVDLVAAVHDKGLALRDLTPGNVMVTPKGELLLIDTEFVAMAGERVTPVGTPGFMAPEVRTGAARIGADGTGADGTGAARTGVDRTIVATTAADLYSLGATLFYLCTGSVPYLADDRPGTADGPQSQPRPRSRPHDARVRNLVGAVAADSPALAALAPLVTALMREQPERRPEPAEAKDALRTMPAPHAPPTAWAIVEPPQPLVPIDAERLLTDGWDELAAALTPSSGRAPWSAPTVGGKRFDPFAVHAGGAGTLEVLRRGAQTGHGGERLRDALRTALTWLDRHVDRESRQLPGLYFGRAGTYWAMYEAADTLGEEEIRQRSARRAKRLPTVWPVADITHGLAGNGLAQSHLWRRTGDEEFRDRVERCVTSLLDARTAQGHRWLEPDELRGTPNPGDLGFAHGIAGIATFVLAAARDLDRTDLLDAAARSGELLVSLAREDGNGVTWPGATASTDDDLAMRLAYGCGWCNGAPGIGTFLIRLWQVTGDDRLRAVAHRAAVSARRQKWLLGPSHCHGLAGNGEFLLDMAAATGESRYRDWAAEHVTALHRFCALREDRWVVVAESATGSSDLLHSYNLGMAGPIGFLHRFHHGGDRWWMADDSPPTAPSRGQDRPWRA